MVFLKRFNLTSTNRKILNNNRKKFLFFGLRFLRYVYQIKTEAYLFRQPLTRVRGSVTKTFCQRMKTEPRTPVRGCARINIYNGVFKML